MKNGIIWIKSKQTVNVFLLKKGFEFLSSNQFNLRKRSKTKKNQVQTSSDFSEEPQSKLFVCALSYAFISVGFEIFSLTHYSWFPVIFARFWLGTLSESSFPVMCLWKYIRIQQKWKQMIWKSIKNKRSLEIWKNSNRNSWKAL